MDVEWPWLKISSSRGQLTELWQTGHRDLLAQVARLHTDRVVRREIHDRDGALLPIDVRVADDATTGARVRFRHGAHRLPATLVQLERDDLGHQSDIRMIAYDPRVPT